MTDCLIFGSATRDDFSSESDVDVVVAFDKDQRVTFFRLNRLAEQMAQILGHPVDLHTWAEIHPKLQPKIQQEGVSVLERPAG
ncbi:MAG: nucleotidyltransferase family protein [Sulfobacillus sp.]